MIDFALILQSYPKLLQGALISLKITAVAAILGLSLGVLLSFFATYKNRLLKTAVTAYVTLVRGTPTLVQILIVYYVFPQFGLHIEPFWAASFALGINSSAYTSQIIRTGMQAVSKGQIEAAQTLGFSHFGTMRHIVFPQALQAAKPALGNEFITLVKDSSLASIIGVVELAKEGSIIRSRTYDAFSILLAVSLIYLILTALLHFCMNKVGAHQDAAS